MPPSPASTFAALLRRSKFASFDPTVAQVYTSHGGDIARGNWGLKRPLPLRRKGAYITVSAVDSKEQQTEWSPADKQGRWIQMWDEVGVTPQLESGPWRTRIGPQVSVSEDNIETEFSWPKPLKVHRTVPTEMPSRDEHVDGVSEPLDGEDVDQTLLRMLEPGAGASVPNIYAMSDKQFKKYLTKIRELRPAFSAYRKLLADAERRDDQESMWQGIPADHTDQFQTFLAKHAQEELTSPESRVIEQQPQKVAGLSYAGGSLLQSQLLQRPQAGRILSNARKEHAHDDGSYLRTSYGGMLANLNKNWRGDATDEVDWKTLGETGLHDPQRGVGKFHLINAFLTSAPAVVGEKSGFMDGIKLETHIKAVGPEDLGQSEEKTPGAVRWMVSPKPEGPKSLRGSMAPRKPVSQPGATKDAKVLLGTLGDLLNVPEEPASDH